MLKRILCILLVFVFVFCLVPFSATADTSVTQTITSINGRRNENYLVLYTSNYGSTTGTNAYGTEVVVENGRVTSVGGNNCAIPGNGFVISGHGTMKDWLNDNVIVGMKASYNQATMIITFTSDSYTATYATTVARDNALAAKAKALEGCYFYDETADTRLAAAEISYQKLDTLTSAQLTALTNEYITISYLYSEREAAQYRGLWLRPTQRTWAEVENYVKQCSDAGINMICIETLYAGTLIYPPKSNSYFSQNPYFNGFDVLNAFVNVCHKYGIELHVWMPVFYSGAKDNNWSLTVACKKPEWQLVDQNGSNVGSDDSSGLIFLNPANDEVQDFLIETYKHLLENYNVDGFQLDYIRYRDRTAKTDFGYDDVTIQKFKKTYTKYANYNITYNEDAAYWSDWVNFRAEQVGNMVKRARALIDEVAPNVVLSADVGASLSSAYWSIYQDSGYWMRQGWLDMIHPMAYGEGYASVMPDFMQYAGDKCAVIPGLGAFMDTLTAEDLLIQTQEMMDVGCHGVIYFESSAFFKKATEKRLGETLFTQETVAPAFDNEETVKASLERIKARIDKAYTEGKISQTVWNNILWQVNSSLSDNETNANSAISHIEGIETQLSGVSSDILASRILLDASIALAAAHRDSADPKDEADKTPIIPEAPNIETELQLIIDSINGSHIGEDSLLITKPSSTSCNDHNLVYAHSMLLEPVAGKTNVYKVVETKTGSGSNFTFKTAITSGMIVASFHTDGTGSGVERVKLAKTVKVGTELNLFGIDVKTATFTSSVAMLYIGELNVSADAGDVNADGVIDQYDYILVKRHYFETRILSDDEKLRADVNGDGTVDQYDYILIARHYFGTYKIG
ncbi:MAG: family 10 glycosylhydrolase [Clostridia bacterium]|nr:family 10 glycosylhydrolase [Clostridia bacterium]